MPHSTDDLAAVADELRAALLHGDAGVVDALLDDDALLTGPFGERAKDELLAVLRPGALRVAAIEVERERLRVLGELATSDTIATASFAYEGAPVTARLRIRATWRLSSDWSLAAAELKPVRPSERFV